VGVHGQVLLRLEFGRSEFLDVDLVSNAEFVDDDEGSGGGVVKDVVQRGLVGGLLLGGGVRVLRALRNLVHCIAIRRSANVLLLLGLTNRFFCDALRHVHV